jgi:hypothetical protein
MPDVCMYDIPLLWAEQFLSYLPDHIFYPKMPATVIANTPKFIILSDAT